MRQSTYTLRTISLETQPLPPSCILLRTKKTPTSYQLVVILFKYNSQPRCVVSDVLWVVKAEITYESYCVDTFRGDLPPPYLVHREMGSHSCHFSSYRSLRTSWEGKAGRSSKYVVAPCWNGLIQRGCDSVSERRCSWSARKMICSIVDRCRVW
jgi:hypothetical protein